MRHTLSTSPAIDPSVRMFLELAAQRTGLRLIDCVVFLILVLQRTVCSCLLVCLTFETMRMGIYLGRLRRVLEEVSKTCPHTMRAVSIKRVAVSPIGHSLLALYLFFVLIFERMRREIS